MICCIHHARLVTRTASLMQLCGHADDASHRVYNRRSNCLSGCMCHWSAPLVFDHRQVQRDRPRCCPFRHSCWLSGMPGDMPVYSPPHTQAEHQELSCQTAQKDESLGLGKESPTQQKWPVSLYTQNAHFVQDDALCTLFNASIMHLCLPCILACTFVRRQSQSTV